MLAHPLEILMLDTQAAALLQMMADRSVPPVHTLEPVDARRFYVERRSFTQPEPPGIGVVQDIAVPGPAGKVQCRLYKPHNTGAALPVLVFFHGGGWVIGDLDTHDVLCRQLVAGAACAVLAVDYRLAPEHRFPGAVDDCLAVTQWVQAQGASLGLDGARIAVGGDSAGGNLAAVVSLCLRDLGGAAPLTQLLIYPATDMRQVAPSHTTNAQGYMLTRDSIEYFRAHYSPDATSWSDWRASPLLAPNLTGLPRALVITAGFDPLRDEGLQYADALSAAGNTVQYVCFERQIHGFITMSRVLDEAHAAVGLCTDALRKVFA